MSDPTSNQATPMCGWVPLVPSDPGTMSNLTIRGHATRDNFTQDDTTPRYRHREATADECPGKTRAEIIAEWSCAHPGATVAGAEKTFDAYVRLGIMIEVWNVETRLVTDPTPTACSPAPNSDQTTQTTDPRDTDARTSLVSIFLLDCCTKVDR